MLSSVRHHTVQFIPKITSIGIINREVSHIQEIGDSGDAVGDARYAESYKRHFKDSAYTISNEHLSHLHLASIYFFENLA